MTGKPRSIQIQAVFLDTSALFSGIWSDRGGARMLLRMGEAQIIKLIVGKHVIGELEEVFSRKYPNGLRTLAILLDRCRVEVVPTSTPEILSHCLELVDFAGDAKVLAEAWGSGANCFVTLDKSHFILNKRLSEAPFKISTPGDCLAWLRQGWILD